MRNVQGEGVAPPLLDAPSAQVHDCDRLHCSSLGVRCGGVPDERTRSSRQSIRCRGERSEIRGTRRACNSSTHQFDRRQSKYFYAFCSRRLTRLLMKRNTMYRDARSPTRLVIARALSTTLV